ncbi:MAG: di-trans,poly-cis-decaprenylcistransferase [Puniceicoccales bacterium]|jgi:undecaprenyl diphosphate synthase|nr:di-trans,poly-cis-decaprenylcistransferase [Puniceicoccales bacterium]
MQQQNPVHVALIMDGNRHWAKEHHLPLSWGYRRGVVRITEIVKSAIEQNIAHLTLFAFSTENWKRPETEVSYLMQLFSRSITHYTPFLLKQEINVRFIGNLNALKPDLVERIMAIQAKTRNYQKLFLKIAVNYSSRDEVIRTMKKIPPCDLQDYSWETFRQQLDTGNCPDVDLLIRTSGNQRLSNFLLLQSAYAELIFVKKNWPDFTKQDFECLIQAFGQHERTFGK